MNYMLRDHLEELLEDNKTIEFNSLLEENLDEVMSSSEKFRANLLVTAIKSDAVDSFIFMLDKGFDPNADFNRGTLLHTAFNFGEYHFAKILLEKGADPTILNARGFHCIVDALTNKEIISTELLRLMKDKGYNPKNKYNNYGSDWYNVITYNKQMLTIFIEVFGEDFEGEIDLPAARKSKDPQILFNELSKFLMKIRFTSYLFDGSTLEEDLFLLLKLAIRLNNIDYAFNLAEILKSKINSEILTHKTSVTIRKLVDIKALISWSRGKCLAESYSDFYEDIRVLDNGEVYSATFEEMNDVPISDLCRVGMSHLINKNSFINNNHITASLFRKSISNKLGLSMHREVFKIILDISNGVNEHAIEDILTLVDKSQMLKHRALFLISIAYFLNEEVVNGEYFLMKAEQAASDIAYFSYVEFEDFFLLLMNNEMIKDLKKAIV